MLYYTLSRESPANVRSKAKGGYMDLKFTKPQAEESSRLAPFFFFLLNKTCDTGVLDTYLWADYYDTRCCVVDDKALLTVMESEGEHFAAMPYCAEEDLPYYFALTEKYFNEVLGKPLKIYLADEEAVTALKLQDNSNYLVREECDFRDYLYDAEELRTLPGKRFHKKKNLVNKFMREYEGRWEYRSMSCQDKQTVWEFLDRWYAKRSQEEINGEESLEYEVNGIHAVLQNCFWIDYRMGGIFIDGQLEAFSMGAYNPREKMACIDIEKGNSEIPGIYQMINQQFLLHEFPDAELVNREDDVGLEGLRRSKESYNPIAYERKYMVLQKNFGDWQDELKDQYEAEIDNYEADRSEGTDGSQG